ncbi:MAG: hypothetical protein ACYCV4_02810 [Dermatophilaceae bacterium]
MDADEPVRSSEARAAAELALVRVVHHYGEKPGFVLLGGLVPPLLCSRSGFRHAGTTDVDVQVDLEIAGGATHTRQLEQALTNADFHPDSARVWRWEMRTDTGRKTRVKFELLEGHGRYGAARHRLPSHGGSGKGPCCYRVR